MEGSEIKEKNISFLKAHNVQVFFHSKGTVGVISNYLPLKDRGVQYYTIPLVTLSGLRLSSCRYSFFLWREMLVFESVTVQCTINLML